MLRDAKVLAGTLAFVRHSAPATVSHVDCRSDRERLALSPQEITLPKVTFIQHSGTTRTVDATSGSSLMQAALDNSVPGIDADCSGSCACGTCHVMVDAGWAQAVGNPGDMEEAMLSMRPDRSAHSRLACQIVVDEALDGLVVRLPEHQM
jgi:2Fe-2S ferredoxin